MNITGRCKLELTVDLVAGVVVRASGPVHIFALALAGTTSVAVAAADRTLLGRALLLDFAHVVRRCFRGVALARIWGRSGGGHANAEEGEETEDCDLHDIGFRRVGDCVGMIMGRTGYVG